MEIKQRAMGAYQTNCYILYLDKGEVIIDPGMGATNWVVESVKNPLAILNTHGHFDHVWSDAELQKRLNIPVYCPKGDIFMLQKDPFSQGTPVCKADVEVEPDSVVEIGGEEFIFRHFPGHTPGCSIIEIGDVWFSGDFIFRQSIGRWDFPYSSGRDMIKSLKKAMSIDRDYTLYPGHGPHTTLNYEKRNLPYWIEQVKATL